MPSLPPFVRIGICKAFDKRTDAGPVNIRATQEASRSAPTTGRADTVDARNSNLTYSANRLTVEKLESTFAPQDWVGQLTMRSLDIADTRGKLATSTWIGLLAPGTSDVPRLDPPDPAG